MLCPALSCHANMEQAGFRTRRMTTLRARPLSLRPSGLAESPLLRMGLVLRLLVVELVLELLEKPDFRRLGMMRTMAGETRGRRPV